MPSIERDKLNLCGADLENLRESGLTDSTIRRNGIYTEYRPDRLAEILNQPETSQVCLGSGMVFPYRDLQGTVNCFARVRPLSPRKKDGKPVKYEQPKGQKLRAYFPAECVAELRKPGVGIAITEGEKKALALAQIGEPTIGLGGVECGCKDGQLIDDLAQIDWNGRDAFIVFDYDEKEQTRANVTAAKHRLAAALHAAGANEVYDVVLPPAPDGGKQGIDDFLLENGKAAFDALVQAAQPVFNRCPVDSLKALTVDPFPVEALPRTLQKYVLSVAEALPCPPDYPGAMLLAVLAAFIGRKVGIEVKPRWVEYPVLWVVCIARSGDRKTPAFLAVTEPLRRKQKTLLAKYLQAKKAYDDLSAEEKQKESAPRLQQLLTTDTTIEALKDVLAGNPSGIIYPADELAGWVRAMAQYKGGRGDDRQHWLSIWSGVQIVCNRKGQDPIIINSPFVTVTGGIQPDALGDIIEDREDGFSARLLCSYPDPIPNREWTDDAMQSDVLLQGVCDSLFELESDQIVTFSAESKALWVEWVNKHRAEIPQDNLRAVWSKAEGHCARLALVLYLSRRACNETKATKIDPDSMRGAIKLVEYFKNHSRRVYSVRAEQADEGRIGKALKWIRKQGGKVTARQLHLHGHAKNTEGAKQLLSDLAELGHGKTAEEARNSFTFTLSNGSYESTSQRVDA